MTRCPLCKIPTDLIHYERVPIYSCGSCGGHWVTKAKLDLILARREVQMPAAVQKKMLAIAAASDSKAALFCMTCGAAMRRERFKFWPEIQIDVCPKCQGIWLDRGELEKCQIFWEYAQGHPDQARAASPQSLAELQAAMKRKAELGRPIPPETPAPPPRPARPRRAEPTSVHVRETEPDPDFLAGEKRSGLGRILGDLFGR